MAAFALGFTACDDETTAIPQKNPQEAVMEADGIAVEIPAATATAVSLADFEADDNGVPVLDVTKLENFPSYYELKGVMQYADDESFANCKEVPMTFADKKTGYVTVEAWETAHLSLYSKNPRETKSYVRFALYGVNGTSSVRLGGTPGVYFAQHQLNVTPLPAKVVIEDHYYMINAAGEVLGEMNAANPADVYNPASFSYSVNVGENETVEVKVKSESGKVYGIDPNEEGKLRENGNAIVLDEFGPQLVSVNMEEMTYSVAMAIKTLYAYTSSANLGNPLETADFVTYRGFAGFTQAGFYLANEKKLRPSMKWGAGVDADGNEVAGTLSLNGARVTLDAAGAYFLSVNLPALTYEATYLEGFYMVGSFQDWDITAGVEMTPDAKFTKWTADVEMTDGAEFKFFTNNDWDTPNLGAPSKDEPYGYDNLTEHGENLVWNLGDGTFTVTLDFSTTPYTMTAVKK